MTRVTATPDRPPAGAGPVTDGRVRVLHVGPLPPPLGGVATALQMILACPALQGFGQTVFNTSAGGPTEVVGRKLPSVGRVFRRVRQAFALAGRVRRERPQLVHVQCGAEGAWSMLGDFALVWAGGAGGGRVIVHLHVDPSTAFFPGGTGWRQRVFRWLARPADDMFVLTTAYRDHLLALGVRQPVHVVPNMCDETLLDLAPDRTRTPAEVRVLFLGRLTRAKGLFDLLAAAARARSACSELRFDVAGVPSTPQEEHTIAEVMRHERLEATLSLCGLVTGDAKRRLLERADILVAPSHWESFGIVAIEAMAAGLPVVAARVRGLGSIVEDGQTGFLFAPGDVDAMAQHLVRLARDGALRLRFGWAGRESYLARYASARVGATIAEAYGATGSGELPALG